MGGKPAGWLLPLQDRFFAISVASTSIASGSAIVLLLMVTLPPILSRARPSQHEFSEGGASEEAVMALAVGHGGDAAIAHRTEVGAAV